MIIKNFKFDLTNDGNDFVCRNKPGYTISNVSDFTRTCQCIRDENYKKELLIEFIVWLYMIMDDKIKTIKDICETNFGTAYQTYKEIVKILILGFKMLKTT